MLNKKYKKLSVLILVLTITSLGVVGCSNPTHRDINNNILELQNKVLDLENYKSELEEKLTLIETKVDNLYSNTSVDENKDTELNDVEILEFDEPRLYNVKAEVTLGKNTDILANSGILNVCIDVDNKTGKLMTGLTGEVLVTDSKSGKSVTQYVTFENLSIQHSRNELLVKDLEIKNLLGVFIKLDITDLNMDFIPVNVKFSDGTSISQ